MSDGKEEKTKDETKKDSSPPKPRPTQGKSLNSEERGTKNFNKKE